MRCLKYLTLIISDVPEVFDVLDVFDVPEVYPEMLLRCYIYVMLSI